MKTQLVLVDPEVQSGEPVFYGTRVPVKSLFDYLAMGDSLESYLADYSGVTRTQALATIDLAGDLLRQTYSLVLDERAAG